MDIAVQRLYNQHITGPKLASPEAVVRWLGAVQSQDYAGAKWSLGQRMDGVTDAAIDEAFAKGAILRTHVLRPTWHFVTADDILWILELTAPRVHALNAYYYRQLELDTNVLDRSHTIIEQSLRGGIQLTRPELGAALAKAGIVAETLRLTYIVMHAELDGVICSGALRGKQQTYALVADRVPNAKRMPRDEALAELTHRYFTGHGPITLKDYVWWSGLSASDARSGLEMNKHRLSSETVEGQTYWFGASMPPAKPMPMMAHLIPE